MTHTVTMARGHPHTRVLENMPIIQIQISGGESALQLERLF